MVLSTVSTALIVSVILTLIALFTFGFIKEDVQKRMFKTYVAFQPPHHMKMLFSYKKPKVP
ncbi:hypothetical protein LSG31_03140 [Fodinisporobacter ferrooxydans]|uniref:Uncharacterized protein n=1 Tax=Fodinisporobacter ferrooxydans TaxID=2901836 RepID=A0ABY4CP97_9BACL|nr:hypothetical protein LSG31_03140 [Alicyclobacillaceae bacterium MYW30-H2]